MKQGLKNISAIAARKREILHMSLHKPSSAEELIVTDSPRNNFRHIKRPYGDPDTNRRGSLPSLKLATSKSQRPTSVSSSDDSDSPYRRGRQNQVRENKAAALRRRGNSLTRLQDKRPNNSSRVTQHSSNRLYLPPNHQRSKSEIALSNNKIQSLRR